MFKTFYIGLSSLSTLNSHKSICVLQFGQNAFIFNHSRNSPSQQTTTYDGLQAHFMVFSLLKSNDPLLIHPNWERAGIFLFGQADSSFLVPSSQKSELAADRLIDSCRPSTACVWNWSIEWRSVREKSSRFLLLHKIARNCAADQIANPLIILPYSCRTTLL